MAEWISFVKGFWEEGSATVLAEAGEWSIHRLGTGVSFWCQWLAVSNQRVRRRYGN
jgi:Co/Zn/Cd efflux system component